MPGQFSRGWETAKNPPYPQTLVIQFIAKVELRQVQLLSHNTKIATKVDLLYFGGDGYHSGDDVRKFKFHRLGYLSLSSNQSTGFSVRELKSVYITSKCAFLKLVLHEPHRNEFNQHMQVGLVALSCFGFPLQKLSPLLCNVVIQERLKAFDNEKTVAVERNEFDKAKVLKIMLDKLQQAYGYLSVLEGNRAGAVKAGAHDNANMISMEIVRIRNGLLIDPSAILGGPMSMQPTANSQPAHTFAYKPATVPAAKQPALARSEAPRAESLPQNVEALRRARKAADRYSSGIRSEVLDSLFSPSREVRLKTLDAFQEQMSSQRLEKIALGDADKAALAVLGISNILLSDEDSRVIEKTARLVEDSILRYPFDLDAEDSIYFTHIDSLLAALTNCLTNESFRIQDRIINTMTQIATSENVSLTTLVWNVTRAGVGGSTEVCVLAKLRLLEELVRQQGAREKSGVGKRLIDFAVACFKHSSAAVSAESVKLLSECRNVQGAERMNELLKSLPANEIRRILAPVKEEARACDYCGKTGIASDDALDWHLYKICPMLMHCLECGFILEIANLNTHLLKECREKSVYKECENCREAVRVDRWSVHKESRCSRADSSAIRCAKCHDNVRPGTMKAWKQHILGKNCRKFNQ